MNRLNIEENEEGYSASLFMDDDYNITGLKVFYKGEEVEEWPGSADSYFEEQYLSYKERSIEDVADPTQW